MTQPVILPGMADAGDDDDAADKLSRLVAGNQHLITHPHLVTALYAANSTPQQASAINQFVGGMKATAAVQAARLTGTKVVIDGASKLALSAMGTNYSDVEYTQADQQAEVDALQAKLTASEQSPAKGKGWGLGRIWHDATHNPVTNEIGNLPGQIAGVGNWSRVAIEHLTGSYSDDDKAAAKAQGYDLNSAFSAMAYEASGHRPINADTLYAGQPTDRVNAALAYVNDPNGFVKAIEADQTLTPAQVGDKINGYTNDKDFQALVLRIRADQPTPGNLLTYGIDPVKHPALQADLSGAITTAYLLLADPTNVALTAGFKAAKLASAGLDGIGDTQKINDVYLGVTKGKTAADTRRGMQSFIDNTTLLREAVAKNDRPAIAAATARIHTMNPGLEHLSGEFTTGAKSVDLTGRNFVDGAPITNMAEAAEYLSSKAGVLRLMGGRPTLEGRLMPGQLSAFGAKKLRGALASADLPWYLKTLNAPGQVREADRVFNLNKNGVAERILPKAGADQVDVATGKVIAAPEVDAAEMASRVRGQSDFESRTVQLTGNKAVDTALGWVWPPAIINRGRLLAQRMTSYLARSPVFDITDPNSVEQVRKYAQMYLTNGDAYLIAGRYAAADEGGRKAILTGLHLQTLHAAGFAHTETGQQIIADAARSLTDEKYSAIRGLDHRVDPDTGEDQAFAIYDTQVQQKVTLTRFQDLQKHAAKIGIWESTIGRMFQSQLVDNLLPIVKKGWLTTGTNVARNAGEELVLAATRGDFGDVMRAKAVAIQHDLLPQRSKLGNLIAAPLMRVGERYRKLAVDTADPSLGLDYIAKLDPEFASMLADNWMNVHAGSMVDPAGVGDVGDITRAGYMPTKMKMKRTGYGDVSVDEDMVGADRLAQALATRIDGNPLHADAVISAVEDPATFDLSSIVASLKSPENAKRVGQMRMANTFVDADGVVRNAVTAEEKDLALHQLAEMQLQDMRWILQGRNGDLNQELVDYIRENGAAPSPRWVMDHMTGEQRPLTVNAPMFEARPVQGGITGIVGALNDISGRGYKYVVERPISRISTMPIFLSNYGKARAFLADAEKDLIDGGMTPAAADKMMMEHAMDRAFHRTVTQVDDPTLRTQMDVVGRNFFAFSRATTAFIRRWGNSFIEDPSRLRKMMIAIDGGTNSGLVWTDQNGQKQFSFPGSGAAINGFMKAASVLPGVNMFRVPGVLPNLTGKVALLQPGLQNPLQFGLTPMVNMPFRAVEQLFPQHRQAMDSVDQFFNGTQGQGQPLWAELMPTSAKKFSDILGDGGDSMTAGAMRTAILNLEAAGRTPPADADPATVENWLKDLQVQTKNQLVIRAIAGFFTPAPPGQPTNESAGSHEDWIYGATGVRGLDAEYKKLLNDSGGDPARASQIWAELHPDKLFYTTATTTNSTKSATFAATTAAQSWLDNNLGFMQKYKGVSAYFIPQSTQEGDFDLGAYNAELELGLRQHKTTADFYTDVRTANAASEYYASTAARDAAIKENPQLKTQINQQFSDWNKTFNSLNPLWAQKTQDYSAQDYSAQAVTALGQLSTLRQMVKAKGLPSSVPSGDVKDMIDAYDTYHATYNEYPGSTNLANAIHATLSAQFNEYMQAKVAENPALAGVYQGVFRSLDGKVLDKLGSV